MSDVLALPERHRLALMASPLPTEDRRPARQSQLETLAQLSQRSPPHLAPALDMLLAACCTGISAGPAVLQPIWAEEAMHRVCMMMRLFGTRRYPTDIYEQNLARDLAALFKLLDAPSVQEVLPCSHLLRGIAADLVGLFAGNAGPGDVTLTTNIQPLRLPAYKRRALILTATELIMNALSHAFRGRICGQIEVSLCRLGFRHARLRIKDDGIGFLHGQPNLHCGVADGLAELLVAELRYIRIDSQTVAEIIFPVGIGGV